MARDLSGNGGTVLEPELDSVLSLLREIADSSGGGGGVAQVDDGNGNPVNMVQPLTRAEFAGPFGATSAGVWSGTGTGTHLAIMKALYGQNATIISLLTDIKTNTTPTP